MARIISIVTLILMVFMFPPAVLALISNNAVPGDAAYPIKRVLEVGILTIASVNPNTKAIFAIKRSDRRFTEVTQLVGVGDTGENLTVSLKDLVKQTQEAAVDIKKIENPEEKTRKIAELKESIKKYKQGVEAERDKIDGPQYPTPSGQTIQPSPTPVQPVYQTPPYQTPSFGSPSPTSTPRVNPSPTPTPVPARTGCGLFSAYCVSTNSCKLPWETCPSPASTAVPTPQPTSVPVPTTGTHRPTPTPTTALRPTSTPRPTVTPAPTAVPTQVPVIPTPAPPALRQPNCNDPNSFPRRSEFIDACLGEVERGLAVPDAPVNSRGTGGANDSNVPAPTSTPVPTPTPGDESNIQTRPSSLNRNNTSTPTPIPTNTSILQPIFTPQPTPVPEQKKAPPVSSSQVIICSACDADVVNAGDGLVNSVDISALNNCSILKSLSSNPGLASDCGKMDKNGNDRIDSEEVSCATSKVGQICVP